MDRDALVRDTYAHYGLAMYQAQVLEHGIVNAMLCARMPDRDRITRADIDAFRDRQFEKTLGALLRELGKHVEVPPDVADALTRALRLRNVLAHDYFRERATVFMTDEGCLAMIAELETYRETFSEADVRLAELVRPIRERFGVTDDRIQAESDEMLRGAEASST